MRLLDLPVLWSALGRGFTLSGNVMQGKVRLASTMPVIKDIGQRQAAGAWPQHRIDYPPSGILRRPVF